MKFSHYKFNRISWAELFAFFRIKNNGRGMFEGYAVKKPPPLLITRPQIVNGKKTVCWHTGTLFYLHFGSGLHISTSSYSDVPAHILHPPAGGAYAQIFGRDSLQLVIKVFKYCYWAIHGTAYGTPLGGLHTPFCQSKPPQTSNQITTAHPLGADVGPPVAFSTVPYALVFQDLGGHPCLFDQASGGHLYGEIMIHARHGTDSHTLPAFNAPIGTRGSDKFIDSGIVFMVHF